MSPSPLHIVRDGNGGGYGYYQLKKPTMPYDVSSGESSIIEDGPVVEKVSERTQRRISFPDQLTQFPPCKHKHTNLGGGGARENFLAYKQTLPGSRAKAALSRQDERILSSQTQASNAETVRDWLEDLMDPVSPSKRYEQGLDPKADHPLHPQPLKVIKSPKMGRQPLAWNTYHPVYNFGTGAKYEFSNDYHNFQLTPAPRFLLSEDDLNVNKKRMTTETPVDGPRASKRARVVQSVRDVSRRLSTVLSFHDDGKKTMATPSDDDGRRAAESKASMRRASSKRRSRPATWFLGQPLPIENMYANPVLVARAPNATFMRPDVFLKVLVLGGRGVGKTTMIQQFVVRTCNVTSYDMADASLQSPPGAMTRIMIQREKANIEVELRDGGDPDSAWFDVAIICYDVNNIGTAASLRQYRDAVWRLDKRPIIVLAGLKLDERAAGPSLPLTFLMEPDAVTSDQGAALADNLGAVHWTECSSNTGHGVRALFDRVADLGLAKRHAEADKTTAWRRARVESLPREIGQGFKKLWK